MTFALSVLVLTASAPTAFEARAKALFEATSAPGMTCAVRYADGKVESYGFGYADKERGISMTTSHRMPAGSTGKTFFAAAMLQLAGEGKLDLDKPIRAYVGAKPWFQKLPNAEALTLRLLMNHTSGIPEYVADKEVVELLGADADRVFGHEELVDRFIAGKKPLFEAGKGWSYADANFVLAGVVVESALKLDLYREIAKRFLRPFDLRETAPSDRRVLKDVAVGYSMPNSPFLPAGSVLENGKFKLNPQFEWAGGGFASTSKDLARWAYSLMSGKVLGPKMTQEMLAGVPARTGARDQYGLGAMIETLSTGVSYGHEGWFPGYLTQMAYFPEKGIAIAVQFNTDEGAALKRRTRYFVDELARAAIGGEWDRIAIRPRRNAGMLPRSAE